MRVLIVDDSPAMRAVLTDILHRCLPGWQVLEAADGTEGLDIALHSHPDLIFLDGNMTEMDGVNMAKQLRQTPETHDIPLIGMTAQRPTSKLFQQLSAVCNVCLSKPFNFDELIHVVKKQTFNSSHLLV